MLIHFLKTLLLRWLLLKMTASDPSYFADFEHVKIFSSHFADFEHVKIFSSHFTDFEHVKIFSSHFADFEHVKILVVIFFNNNYRFRNFWLFA